MQRDQGLQALWQHAQQVQRRHQQHEQSVLEAVIRLDPALGEILRDVLGDSAAPWLLAPNSTGDSPLERLAVGDRQGVLDTLLRIQYGVYA